MAEIKALNPKVFASNPHKEGEVIEFPNYEAGWGESLVNPDANGRPPMEWTNFIVQKQDENLLHIAQHGVAAWHKDIEYQKGAKCFFNGVIYNAKESSKGVEPTKDDYWEKETKRVEDITKKVDSTNIGSTSASSIPKVKSKDDLLKLPVGWRSMCDASEYSSLQKLLGTYPYIEKVANRNKDGGCYFRAYALDSAKEALGVIPDEKASDIIWVLQPTRDELDAAKKQADKAVADASNSLKAANSKLPAVPGICKKIWSGTMAGNATQVNFGANYAGKMMWFKKKNGSVGFYPPIRIPNQAFNDVHLAGMIDDSCRGNLTPTSFKMNSDQTGQISEIWVEA